MASDATLWSRGEDHMIQYSVKNLFNAVWIALLATGAAGGLTFLVVASSLVNIEDWADRLISEKLKKQIRS